MHLENKKIVLAPTDLSNFLSCRHLSRLDLSVARGTKERPVRYGPVLDELKARGQAHEKAYLEHLQALGFDIAHCCDPDMDEESIKHGVDKTIAAMQAGVDIIYQATLADDAWYGRADFLRKVALLSNFGNWSYEVIDPKLAHDTKAGTILQLCVYSYLLEKLQGVRPERMYVVTPGSVYEPLKYRLADYDAYVRLLERGIGQFLTNPGETYPDLVSHCDLCAWWSECEKRRRGDDHLCYVAGISNGQIKNLRAIGVERLAELARLDEIPDLRQVSQESMARVRDQARVQLISREKQVPYYELKEPFNLEHGLAMLPEPTPDDIFLDFEGNHFAEQGVREYLTGYLSRGDDGQVIYTPVWARTLEE